MEQSSMQMPRKFVSIDERIQIIHESESQPCTKELAKLFNCTELQIACIIQCKEEHLTRYANRIRNTGNDEDRRQRIEFLEKVVYEFILRAVYHNVELDDEILNEKIMNVKNSLAISCWYPTLYWLQKFKTAYKIYGLDSTSLKQLLVPGEEKQKSLEIHNIVDYVRSFNVQNEEEEIKRRKSIIKSKATDNLTDDDKLQDKQPSPPTVAAASSKEPMSESRNEQIDFLGKCMYEYIQRAQYHLNESFNMSIWLVKAKKFNEYLKIDSFVPNKEWLTFFKYNYQISKYQKTLILNRTPPSSLDPRSIIRYCKQNKEATCVNQQIETVEPIQSEHETITVELKTKIKALIRAKTIVDTETSDGADQVLYMETFTNKNSNDAELIIPECLSVITPPTAVSEDIKPVTEELEVEWLLDDFEEQADELSVKERTLCGVSTVECDIDVKPDINVLQQGIEVQNNIEMPPLKIQRISADTMSQHREEFLIEVNSKAGALKLLKPLEDFALLEENYRAIGLITQLQQIFENRYKS